MTEEPNIEGYRDPATRQSRRKLRVMIAVVAGVIALGVLWSLLRSGDTPQEQSWHPPAQPPQFEVTPEEAIAPPPAPPR